MLGGWLLAALCVLLDAFLPACFHQSWQAKVHTCFACLVRLPSPIVCITCCHPLPRKRLPAYLHAYLPAPAATCLPRAWGGRTSARAPRLPAPRRRQRRAAAAAARRAAANGGVVPAWGPASLAAQSPSTQHAYPPLCSCATSIIFMSTSPLSLHSVFSALGTPFCYVAVDLAFHQSFTHPVFITPVCSFSSLPCISPPHRPPQPHLHSCCPCPVTKEQQRRLPSRRKQQSLLTGPLFFLPPAARSSPLLAQARALLPMLPSCNFHVAAMCCARLTEPEPVWQATCKIMK